MVTDVPTREGLSLNIDVVDCIFANQRQNCRDRSAQNRMVPQSQRRISASMTEIEQERRGLCAGVRSPVHHGFKTPGVAAE
jgi:hypothetical protein